MTNAVEKAKETLKPSTSGDEDAFLLAELIHGLGLQARSAEFTAPANGQTLESEYSLGKTVAQHISECEERISGLWEKAADAGIRRLVEDALPVIQANWRKRAADPQPPNGRVE